ncbi:hypothetical protein UFOVP116_63 [uncultured Caudovirales phage]|uniref:C2H2-type domain-containing protein n=1 Tax=uncultured Caudovirales phage TaxID=2100421 RepID=A0A6J5L5K2_9CAUD|nr:hypothetical protein UFOVP116_63 [uncultured Caudovirales phage]
MTGESKTSSDLTAIGEILLIHSKLKHTVDNSEQFVCQHCSKAFKRPKTLVNHLCEGKRRWQQEKEMGVQHGLRAFVRFYQLTQSSTKTKTYADFVASPYYLAFVKFGRYCIDIRHINIPHYTDWLLKNNKRLDDWCKDALYLEWLHSYLQTENPQDALERALKEMQNFAHSENIVFNDYFKSGKTNRICQHISNGRISAWVLYNCDTGVEFLATLQEDQIPQVFPWIDPTMWSRKFKNHPEDTAWVKQILKTAGL